MNEIEYSQRINRYLELIELWNVCQDFKEDHDVHYKTKRVCNMPLTTESKKVITSYIWSIKI